MANEESKEHHFVPQFLLRSWAVEGMLRGYWWNERRGELACKRKGPKAFCFQLDLLTLRAHSSGRDALEKVFFGDIDTRGAEARDRLLASGPKGLTGDQRCDFARLLLSLEARRPSIVGKLREEGRPHFADALDNDPEILAAMSEEGLSGAPSSFAEQSLGIHLEDRALAVVQGLVDHPKVGGKLINACWHIVRLGSCDGSFVLGDRPLFRKCDYDHPGAAWVLPLTPKAAFVAVNHPANLERIKRASLQRFAKQINVDSARRAERFVFCVDTNHEQWVGKYLSGSLTNS